MTKKYNVLLDVDSYKLSHFKQYPFETGYVSSYIESRGGRFDKVLFAGLQIFLKKLENNPITLEMIDEAEDYIVPHGLPFNREGWEYIVKTHNGRLPIVVEAVAEGTLVNTKNVLAQIRNTDPNVPWLTSYLETALLRAVWYPTTVATVSFETKRVIRDYWVKTTGSDVGSEFALHDFGSRGVSSAESAGIGGVAHLFNSMGTDTIEALVVARECYNEPMAAFSVPASEHSTATSWGPTREVEYVERMIDGFDTPIVSVVSDSYNHFELVEKVILGELLTKIQESGKKFVIRPDSGIPVDVLRKTFRMIEDKLEIERNAHGYKVLPEYLGVLQGDGVNRDSVEEILQMLESEGWAASNIVFGMGGELLQNLNRDTQKFAMKASAYMPKGSNPESHIGWVGVGKDPITDQGKKSKKGRLILAKQGADYNTYNMDEVSFDIIHRSNKLRKVFENGHIVRFYTLTEIRDLVQQQ